MRAHITFLYLFLILDGRKICYKGSFKKTKTKSAGTMGQKTDGLLSHIKFQYFVTSGGARGRSIWRVIDFLVVMFFYYSFRGGRAVLLPRCN